MEKNLNHVAANKARNKCEIRVLLEGPHAHFKNLKYPQTGKNQIFFLLEVQYILSLIGMRLDPLSVQT
jgi:hypothetical protein